MRVACRRCRIQSSLWYRLLRLSGKRPKQSGNGSSRLFIIFHPHVVSRASDQRNGRAIVCSGPMVCPIIDNKRIVYPKPYAIIGDGTKGIISGDRRLHGACLPCGKIIDIDLRCRRAVAPREVDLWLDATYYRRTREVNRVKVQTAQSRSTA